jgi:hypothetical protein
VETGDDNWTLLFTKRDVNAGNMDYLSILGGSCVVADPQGMSAAIDIGKVLHSASGIHIHWW